MSYVQKARLTFIGIDDELKMMLVVFIVLI